MANYFFDTSAIAKRYCLEAGTSTVERLLGEPSDICLVSRLTVIELHSVFAAKVRRNEIASEDFDLLRRRFLADVKQRLFRVATLAPQMFHTAVILLRDHAVSDALRSLDSIQLAAALELRRRGRMDYFVTADKSLATVASKVGIRVLNPELE